MSIAKDSSLTSGALRGVTGPLVKVPINAIPFTSSGPTATLGTNALNADGSTANLPMSVPAGPAGGVWATANLGGTVVGPRWRGDTGTTPDFDFICDGIAYRVEAANPRFNNVAQSVTDYESSFVVSGLPDIVHTVTVAINANQAGGATRTLNQLGWVCQQGRGYNPPPALPRSGSMSSVTTLGTSNSSVVYNTAIRAIWVNNTDTVPRIVTVTLPDLTTPIFVATLAAGASASFPLTGPTNPSGWKWKADAAAKVLAWTENV